jgi:pyridoxamine 5'-phosphate oxidase
MPAGPSLSADPIRQFQTWFQAARRDKRIELAEAMCLSTVTPSGQPSARMVLLKAVDREGFQFFTNIHSPKARELQTHPRAALTFHWGPQKRQVRIEGKTVRLPKPVADAYFATRPRESQIGSWASRQSQTLESRALLLSAFEKLRKLFEGKKVPAPPHWQGFRVIPHRIEFWQQGVHRLHDRWVYVRGSSGRWSRKRLYP